MEGLSFDNILGEQEIETLFTDPEDNGVPEEPTKNEEEEEIETPDSDPKKQKEKDNTTEDVDPENLFEDKAPESVGSGKDNEGKEGTAPDNDADGTSPNNFYSSIANACAVDGIFPNLDDETIKKAIDAESFSNLIEAEINARFDEKQKRISQALENGVEPNDIKKYESTLSYINTITDAAIAEESEKGEQLRYNLIYQDFINKGMTPDKAKKFADRTVDAGTDVEDAKEALLSNKEFFTGAITRCFRRLSRKLMKRRLRERRMPRNWKRLL